MITKAVEHEGALWTVVYMCGSSLYSDTFDTEEEARALLEEEEGKAFLIVSELSDSVMHVTRESRT